MLSKLYVAWLWLPVILLAGAGGAFGQDYPIKPIRILASGIGGASDFVARLSANGLAGSLGQPTIVDNRDGRLAIEVLIKAPPDGYTMIVAGSSLWLVQFLRDKAPYDPLKDFSPISLATTSPLVIAVHASLPVKSVKELIALAKAKPGVFNYGSSGTGNSNHLAAELFKAMAGVDIVRVNYKGSAAAHNALIGGEVHIAFSPTGSVMSYVKQGRLRALAVTSAQPSALAPDLPTAATSGLPGYEAESVLTLFAPAKTPATLVIRLNQEIVRILNRTDSKEKLFSMGIEVVASSPEQLAAAMKSDMARMGKVIRDAGIRAE